jgi:HlyD family secretion protein
LASSNNNSHGSPVRRRSTWLIVGVAAAALLIPVFSHRGALRVHTATVARGPIRALVSTNGKIEPVENFEAHAPLSTSVKRVFVKEGDRVNKGQPLLELDDADIRSQAARADALLTSAQAEQAALQTGGTHEEVLTIDAQLIKARSARDFAQRNLEALRRLQQQGAASLGEVKQAEDTLRRDQADVTLLEQKQKDRYSRPEVAKVQAQQTEAQAAYDAARDALQKSNVRAPFDGIIYSLPVKQGAYVQAGDLLLQVADLSRVLVRVFVDEPDVGRLAPGQKIEITWDAVPGRTWIGAVSRVPSTVKLHGTRNVGELTGTVDNHDLRLLPNVNVSVSIVTAEHSNVLTLQRDAIRLDETQPYVYLIVDGHLKRQDVSISLQNLTRVEITAGLQENAVVALSAEDTKPLLEGAAVKLAH